MVSRSRRPASGLATLSSSRPSLAMVPLTSSTTCASRSVPRLGMFNSIMRRLLFFSGHEVGKRLAPAHQADQAAIHDNLGRAWLRIILGGHAEAVSAHVEHGQP